MDIPTELQDVATKVTNGDTPRLKLRTLLRHFGQARRGSTVNRRVEDALNGLGLVTVPDFRTVYLDESVHFLSADDVRFGGGQGGAKPSAGNEEEEVTAPEPPETGYVVSRFLADERHRDRKIVAVAPEASVTEAAHLMLTYDYSQLPVMANPKSVLGVISWRTIGEAYALGRNPQTVRDCLAPAASVKKQDTMAHLIDLVEQHDAVLVQDYDRTYVTLFTAADISSLYKTVSQSFVLVGEIEDHLRQLLRRGAFSADELQAACHPDDEREVGRIEELTFGGYAKLLAEPANWERLDLHVDRATFVRQLDEVRELRNAVMHFDPDGLTDEQVEELRRFCRLLRVVRG